MENRSTWLDDNANYKVCDDEYNQQHYPNKIGQIHKGKDLIPLVKYELIELEENYKK